jgi:hypothetical protein
MSLFVESVQPDPSHVLIIWLSSVFIRGNRHSLRLIFILCFFPGSFVRESGVGAPSAMPSGLAP